MKSFFLILLVFSISFVHSHEKNDEKLFYPYQVIVPAALISLGVIIADEPSKLFDRKIQDHRGRTYKIDDYLQYFPHLALYGFSMVGVEAKNSYFDRTLLWGTSGIFVLASVIPLKNIINFERPDASTKNSFPSGHTALAFWGAELVRREYPAWCGVIAYTAATGVGAMRIYNNRHWLGDVVAGAGFGILATSSAYWLLPAEQKLFEKISKKEISATIVPQFDGENLSLSLVFPIK